MAFVVETGDGLTDSNSYISVDYFTSYHTDRGHSSIGTLTDNVIQQICIRATDYIDKRFGRKFRGIRRSHTQGLSWPRLSAYTDDRYLLADIDEIPRRLQQACAEYALRAAVYSELAPDPLLTVPTQDFTEATLPTPATDAAPGGISSLTEKVDVIEESTTYETHTSLAPSPGKNIASSLVSSGNIPEYPAADMLLEELLNNNRRTLIRG